MTLFISPDLAVLSDDLDHAIAAGVPVRVSIVSNAAHGTRGSCDRCTGCARYAGLGGSYCAGCWSMRKKVYRPIIEGTAGLLARRYGLHSEEQLVDSLSDAGGTVRVRASSAPACRLRYHADPAVLLDCLLASNTPAQRLGLQLGGLARVWFGLALRWGVDLHGYPRDGYPAPGEIPWGMVTWVEGDLRAYRWLVKTSLMCRRAYADRYGRDHGAAAQLTWTMPFLLDLGRFLRVQKGALPAPMNVHLERLDFDRAAA
ncbi:MAG: hypothetical protein ACI8RZ_007974 [Myxococcota bacterium]|jgi:hypothetical protein